MREDAEGETEAEDLEEKRNSERLAGRRPT